MHIHLTSDLHDGFNGKTGHKLEKFFRKKSEKHLLDIDIHDNTIFILAGDIISDNPKQIEPILSLIRRYIAVPIFAVLGNHDLWSTSSDPVDSDWYGNRIQLWKDMFKKYDIWYLQNNPFIQENYCVLGFDGWYNLEPGGNDMSWMHEYLNGEYTHKFLREQAHRSVEEILDIDTWGKITIVVTHHSLYVDDPRWETMCGNPKYLEFLTQKADILCMGHSHKRVHFMVNGCEVMNSGSDYNNPKLIYTNRDNPKP